jgi:hypothetical protein
MSTRKFKQKTEEVQSFQPPTVIAPANLSTPPARRSILLWVISAIITIAVVWFVITAIIAHIEASPSGYSAVYLTSGEILIGKLSLSGTPVLIDAWVVEYPSSTLEAQGPLNLLPFKSTSVSPDNTVHISQQQILYWANLDPASALVKELKAKAN